MTLWSRGLLKSRDKLKALYLHHHSAYSHQTWQGGGLHWGAPTYKISLLFCSFTWQIKNIRVIWSFCHVILWDHVTYWIHFISICRRTVTTKLGKVVSWHERLKHLKSHDLILFTWQFREEWPSWSRHYN